MLRPKEDNFPLEVTEAISGLGCLRPFAAPGTNGG